MARFFCNVRKYRGAIIEPYKWTEPLVPHDAQMGLHWLFGYLNCFNRFDLPVVYSCLCLWWPTLVPEVFLDFSSRKNQRQAVKRRQQVAKAKWRERKPPVTLASNLTVMQTTGSGSDSEIRGQGNQRFFSLSSSLSRLVVAASRLALDLFREEKSRKTSGTRVLMTFSSMIILYHRRLIIWDQVGDCQRCRSRWFSVNYPRHRCDHFNPSF